MKPLIGITVDALPDSGDVRTGGKLQLNWNYAQAIADAGGIPVLIPPQADVAALARVIHGWLIPGGNDIDAKHWGEQNHPKVEPISDARFDAERKLFAALDAETPVLGICYGCQLINVLRGGSLIQHLPDLVGHEDHTHGATHTYIVRDETKTHEAIGADVVQGKSYHHQSVGRLGGGLQVVAEHEDGTVEAVEATDRPWMIGVQWHPERTLDDAASRRLFESFIAAARAYAEQPRAVPA